MDRPVFTGTFRDGICVTTGSVMRTRRTGMRRYKKYSAPACAAIEIQRRMRRHTNTPHKQAGGPCLPNPSSMC